MQAAERPAFDPQTGQPRQRRTNGDVWYAAAVFSADSGTLFLGGSGIDPGDTLTARDSKTGMILLRFAEPDPREKVASRAKRIFPRTVQTIALSPDGRLLAAAEFCHAPYDVLLYEVASGKLIKTLNGHSRWANDLAFSSDGRRLVSVGEDETGLVWDVTLPALGGKPAGATLVHAWDRLADSDPGVAYAGMAALAAVPTEAVRLLRAKLRPAGVPTDAELDRLIARLDARAFAEREKALAELGRFGPNVVPGVKARLDRSLTLEIRKRLTQFLDQYDRPNRYQLRCVRGVATLESIGTASAKALLGELAAGPQRDLLTREARAAIGRAAR